jgi:hypothetical protein
VIACSVSAPDASSPAPILTVSYSSSVRFHHCPGAYMNTTSRHEFEPRSMTATCRVCSPARAAARVERQLMPQMIGGAADGQIRSRLGVCRRRAAPGPPSPWMA